MARRVFFSFKYKEDVSRAMVVRNSWVARILNLKSISIEKDKNKIQDFLDAEKKYTL